MRNTSLSEQSLDTFMQRATETPRLIDVEVPLAIVQSEKDLDRFEDLCHYAREKTGIADYEPMSVERWAGKATMNISLQALFELERHFRLGSEKDIPPRVRECFALLMDTLKTYPDRVQITAPVVDQTPADRERLVMEVRQFLAEDGFGPRALNIEVTHNRYSDKILPQAELSLVDFKRLQIERAEKHGERAAKDMVADFRKIDRFDVAGFLNAESLVGLRAVPSSRRPSSGDKEGPDEGSPGGTGGNDASRPRTGRGG